MADDAQPRVWLVDGFNVLHALLGGRDRGSWWRAEPRERLLCLARRFDAEGAEVWVVFDGDRPTAEEEPGPVRSVFAPSADEWLLRRLREHAEPGEVAVVTRDRRLAARLRHRGARVVAPGEFLARCRPTQPPGEAQPPPPGRDS